MRLLKVLAGIILIFTGVFCFANKGTTFINIAFLVGYAMLISGVSGICVFFAFNKKRNTSDLILSEGILTSILGLLVVSNQLITDAAIPVFFGMWVLFSSVLRLVASHKLKVLGVSTWKSVLVIGTIGVIAAMYVFFNTILAALSIVMLVGICLLVQGINVLSVAISLPFKRRQQKQSGK